MAYHRSTVLRAPRGRYHMLQLIGWVGIKPALLLFLSVFADARRCLFPRFPPSAEMGALSWKRQCRGQYGQLPCRAALDLAKRLNGRGLDGLLCGAALLALKRSFGGTKCVMPALLFYSWVCEW